MTSPTTHPGRKSGIALGLSGSLCLLPFLVPFHQYPIKSFHAEWLAGALGLCAALAALPRSDARQPLSGEMLCLLLLAMVFLLQACFLDMVYLALPVAGMLYVLFAALMVWLGQRLVIDHEDKAIHVLACFILAGGLLNAAAGLIQYYGRPAWLEDLVAGLYHSRIYGNIGQTNLYANYLGLGLVALVFLWRSGATGRGGLLAAALLLNIAAALAGSRAWLLYVAWLAGLLLWWSAPADAAMRRNLRRAVLALVTITAITQWTVPRFNEWLGFDLLSDSGLVRSATFNSFTGDSRWEAWGMAWQLFLDHPLMGVGIGQFAGAAFAAGMPPVMAYYGDVWTSPHNLPLQLLAETGLAGALPGCGALLLWWLRNTREACQGTRPAAGFLVAAIGIETIQSLLEYPLWNAHFLGISALLMGAGISCAGTARGASRWVAALLSLCLGTGLWVTLRDYVRMDSVLITGTAQTLQTDLQKAQDQAVMREVAGGILAPVAELWMTQGAPLEAAGANELLSISDRSMRFWPSVTVLSRHVAWLSYAGRHTEAARLLDHLILTYPFRCREVGAILARAAESDQSALSPALARFDSLQARCHPMRGGD